MLRKAKSRLRIPSPGTGLGLIALAVALSGAAYAAVPSTDGVIHSCYNASSNPSGQLRVIDAEAVGKCSKNEKALDFNQRGPKGDTGDTGPIGATSTGAAGAPGVSGYEIVTKTATLTNESNGFELAKGDVVACPSGKSVLGGGAKAEARSGDIPFAADLRSSYPNGSSGWQFDFQRSDGGFFADGDQLTYTAYAICATIGS